MGLLTACLPLTKLGDAAAGTATQPAAGRWEGEQLGLTSPRRACGVLTLRTLERGCLPLIPFKEVQGPERIENHCNSDLSAFQCKDTGNRTEIQCSQF